MTGFQPTSALRLKRWLTPFTLCALFSLNLSLALAADVTAVRVKPSPQSSDIVLDLSSPAGEVNLDNSQPGFATVILDGHLDPTMAQHTLRLAQARNLKVVTWRQMGRQVQVVLRRQSVAPTKIYTLSNPSRLVISMEETGQPTTLAGSVSSQPQSRQIASGVVYRHIVSQSSRGPLNINVLDIDPQNPGIQIVPVLATDGLHGKARVSQMVNKTEGGIAGINASYFKPDSGTLLGALILNKELISGPIYNRVSLGMTADKQFKMERLGLKGRLTTPAGAVLPIANVNQPRFNRNDTILYSARWGGVSPDTTPDYIQLVIDNNHIVSIGTGRQIIPHDGFALVGSRFNTGLAMLKPGDPVNVSVYTTPDWSNMVQAISGGPFLVRNNQVYVDAREQTFKPALYQKPAPRTAVGFTRNNHLLMVTVDGRQKDVSVGVNLVELALIMKNLGAVDAMNFDGGSSTQMVVDGHVANYPTVTGGAPVSSSLVVRRTDGSGLAATNFLMEESSQIEK